MNVNLYVIEDYENETAHRPKKTNPNKANFTYPQRGKTEGCKSLHKRFDFYGRFGYNTIIILLGFGGGHLNNRVVKGDLPLS